MLDAPDPRLGLAGAGPAGPDRLVWTFELAERVVKTCSLS
ncbi:hypothetical protein FRACA_250026 [Frankia canadensis]|uniref:Uncharacterized protein n=1 Tax=Frankia canadensis TaxID=1836972 RepID=A0A2I2KS06_9ACTN|nr:hypothetical protein FRACA_250026 [Frankia canadensis]SOU55741.1 hypothetical protein FRACA_250026 [Frankia canadensis]